MQSKKMVTNSVYKKGKTSVNCFTLTVWNIELCNNKEVHFSMHLTYADEICLLCKWVHRYHLFSKALIRNAICREIIESKINKFLLNQSFQKDTEVSIYCLPRSKYKHNYPIISTIKLLQQMQWKRPCQTKVGGPIQLKQNLKQFIYGKGDVIKVQACIWNVHQSCLDCAINKFLSHSATALMFGRHKIIKKALFVLLKKKQQKNKDKPNGKSHLNFEYIGLF